jgi:SAM-dependent methyltransferase
MTTTYQTHSDAGSGISDSARKLERLRIPQMLTGRSFLDIGCNEGYFCNVAAKRGAARVVGIDFVKTNIEFARAKYPSPIIEWHQQTWASLPAGPYDVILWSSAMHYEMDPATVLRNIADNLAPGGLFILECGIMSGPAKEMIMVQRHSDSRWYPTDEFLTNSLLAPFAVRRVALPEATPGDPIPRTVYHCSRRLPIVLLFRGQTHDGKSTAARHFGLAATKVVGLDLFVYRICMGKFHHSATHQFIKDNFKAHDLTSLYKGLDDAGLTWEYAALLAQTVAPSDASVIIEGLLTDVQVAALTELLRGKAVVWDATRQMPEGSAARPVPRPPT